MVFCCADFFTRYFLCSLLLEVNQLFIYFVILFVFFCDFFRELRIDARSAFYYTGDSGGVSCVIEQSVLSILSTPNQK